VSDIVVDVRGLQKRYGTTVALAGLDLAVRRGAVFGLLGPNGAGKSTTFGILCGWLRADAGHATLLGEPSGAPHRLRGRLTALPQDAQFPRQIKVVDELAHFAVQAGVPRRRARDEAMRVLAAVALPEAAEQRGGELSHGMAKRVGIAQALIGTPELVFLDEPTAGLDPASAKLIKDVVRALAPAATVVISSHNLAELQEICTDGAILDHGRLVVAGSIAALTRRGTEITFTLGANAQVPMDGLVAAFGASAVTLVDAHTLHLLCPADADMAAVIAQALRLLLDFGTPILGVQRGTSLESAYLDAVS